MVGPRARAAGSGLEPGSRGGARGARSAVGVSVLHLAIDCIRTQRGSRFGLAALGPLARFNHLAAHRPPMPWFLGRLFRAETPTTELFC